jgi:hypothetical protein
LLATLDPMDLENPAGDIEPVPIDYREVLYRTGEPLSDVYFPVSRRVSIVAVSAAGASAEVGPPLCFAVRVERDITRSPTCPGAAPHAPWPRCPQSSDVY